MSAYLQRLIATAVNPVGAIHPVVGSIYSLPSKELTTEAPQIEDLSAVARPRHSDDRTGERYTASHLAESGSQGAEGEGFDSVRKVEPLISAGVREQAPAQSRGGARLRSGMAEANRELGEERGQRKASDERGLPERHEAAARERTAPEYVPLVRAAAIDHAASNVLLTFPGNREMHSIPSPDSASAAKNRVPNLVRAVRRAETEPDEIQIHIGRIEVTAMPPPLARPAPKVERKSLNLNEYLKGRHGRDR